jgi:hypothetical protein
MYRTQLVQRKSQWGLDYGVTAGHDLLIAGVPSSAQELNDAAAPTKHPSKAQM